MKKYWKILIFSLIALVFIGMFIFLWQKSKPQPVAYEEFTPTIKDLAKTTVVTGKIEPRNEVNVKPQISGIITQILKEAGQMVQAGEVIAKVKVIPDMQQLSSAQSRVRLANVNLKQAKTDLDREQVLYDKGLVSADEYDKIRQAYRQASEEVAAANDQLQVVRDGVSRTNASASSTLIRSTITGLILDIPVKVGNSADPSVVTTDLDRGSCPTGTYTTTVSGWSRFASIFRMAVRCTNRQTWYPSIRNVKDIAPTLKTVPALLLAVFVDVLPARFLRRPGDDDDDFAFWFVFIEVIR